MIKNSEKIDGVLAIFEQISSIPRCSKSEEKICRWIVKWAEDHQFPFETDHLGNTLIRIPGSRGYKNSQSVALQAHLDMVCEKTRESVHDFSKDGIELIYENEWLSAKDTSLGADNGIGIALAMALAEDKEIDHPPLELLFTVDEESGLIGASGIKENWLQSKILLNIDAEEEGCFIIGCAGACTTIGTIPVEFKKSPENHKAYHLSVDNLKGGHSGLDIHKNRANAIKIIARLIKQLLDKIDIKLGAIQGGSGHNIIPRNAEACLFLSENDAKEAIELIKDFQETINQEYGNIESSIRFSFKEADKGPLKVIKGDDLEKILTHLLETPHGVIHMSNEVAQMVETSVNLASISLNEDKAVVVTSQRSSDHSRLKETTKVIEYLTLSAGGTFRHQDQYPAWQPNINSPLLKQSIDVYQDLFAEKPKVTSLHAGLECGIIGEKIPGIDMLSIGPTVLMPHSPDEKLLIPSVGRVWLLLKELLKTLQ
ncbi:MAG: aminoacyl-histidine dipeptidase [Proteobacteria bacterium]|nr:aminoacyl-histidine dipeptidase [Pseudomonadota bacterium]